jgi:hypothetical protein
VTKKELIAFLQKYPDDTLITIFDGSRIHVLDDSMSWIMSDEERCSPPYQNDPWPEHTLVFSVD